jgi:hypothetical protein
MKSCWETFSYMLARTRGREVTEGQARRWHLAWPGPGAKRDLAARLCNSWGKERARWMGSSEKLAGVLVDAVHHGGDIGEGQLVGDGMGRHTKMELSSIGDTVLELRLQAQCLAKLTFSAIVIAVVKVTKKNDSNR